MTQINPKQGDTIKITSTFKDGENTLSLVGYDIRSVMSNSTGEYPFTVDDSQLLSGVIVAQVETSAIPVGSYQWDIRLTKAGESFSTKSVVIVLGKGVS